MDQTASHKESTTIAAAELFDVSKFKQTIGKTQLSAPKDDSKKMQSFASQSSPGKPGPSTPHSNMPKLSEPPITPPYCNDTTHIATPSSDILILFHENFFDYRR